ncbi:hypothetical protein IKQ19_13305, partial [Candidatus Saccharibacteria bacterium]|nr:hypothetical protein [Candidatus Saccharibacteria bacterium]
VPRLQFLSGSYFCETSQIGEPLFEKQFIEGRKRDNYIFFKEQRNYIASRGEYERFTRKQLAYKDTLLDRVNFLCSVNEITHFVSNLRLSELALQDSYKMSENEIFYLYGCPNAQN